MHEYGHYIDSQNMGWSYLFAVGIPSLWSASFSDDKPVKEWHGKFVNNYYQYTKDDVRKYETRANRRAFRYFSKYYGLEKWNEYLGYPFANPWE